MPPWADDMGNAQPRASHHHHHHQQQQQQQQHQNQQHQHHQQQHRGRGRRESAVDLAAVTEAHGLVTDMLADPGLPAHIVSGLRTLSALLSPPPAAAPSSSSCCAPPRLHHRRSPNRRKGSLLLPPYFRSASDNEEIPFTGERPSALPKLGKQRLRKNLPPSLLRRMSTATWTTTTSATGMPTLEPEPLRKRSTSFRNLQSPPPTAPLTEQDQKRQEEEDEDEEQEERQFSPGLESLIASLPDRHAPPTKEKRSFSTTALPSGHPQRKDSRERKTVASLHPLTPHDVQCLASLHEVATRGSKDEQKDQEEGEEPTIKEEDEDDEEEEEEEEEEELPPLPSFRRSTVMTSDYESSNDSPPSGSEEGAGARLLRSHASVQTSAWTGKGPCALCGRALVLTTPSPLAVAAARPITQQETFDEETEEVDGSVRLSDATYDLEVLANDPLLGLIDIWDFPVFDMERQAGTLILSQMCYRVFLATGLFESFRIPLLPFFAYFHELEKGYRDKPYHNRMHASDVLHGVYFLISQPIPGFCQVSSDTTDSPLHRTLSGREAQEKWPSSRQGTVDQIRAYIDDDDDDDDDEEDDEDEMDVYGVMGANFPALEIMALYAAAAMHDYDHPGRTNAFLVATFSPQAVLYNDRSVLENHHAAAAWSLFLSDDRYNWLRHLDSAEFKRFRFLVIECILATDLKRHFDILAEFSAKINDEESPIDWSSEPDRLLVMQMAIKLADINGPCKCRQLHVQWTHRIAEEFYEQGDEERSLGLPISPFMDRERPQLAKLQESFINHLVAPLCRTYAEAALLPGVWVRVSLDQNAEELSEDDLDLPRRVEEFISGSCRRKGERRRKAVICQQTKNLQDNYDYWIAVLRREEEQLEKVSLRGGATDSDT